MVRSRLHGTATHSLETTSQIYALEIRSKRTGIIRPSILPARVPAYGGSIDHALCSPSRSRPRFRSPSRSLLRPLPSGPLMLASSASAAHVPLHEIIPSPGMCRPGHVEPTATMQKRCDDIKMSAAKMFSHSARLVFSATFPCTQYLLDFRKRKLPFHSSLRSLYHAVH